MEDEQLTLAEVVRTINPIMHNHIERLHALAVVVGALVADRRGDPSFMDALHELAFKSISELPDPAQAVRIEREIEVLLGFPLSKKSVPPSA